MPVVVKCQCGQSFQAPDTLAGKSVPCPACGGALAIPGPTAAVAKFPSAANTERITVRCGCGSQFAAPAQLSGKSVRCPKCRGVLQIPARGTGSASAASPAASSPADYDPLAGLGDLGTTTGADPLSAAGFATGSLSTGSYSLPNATPKARRGPWIKDKKRWLRRTLMGVGVGFGLLVLACGGMFAVAAVNALRKHGGTDDWTTVHDVISGTEVLLPDNVRRDSFVVPGTTMVSFDYTGVSLDQTIFTFNVTHHVPKPETALATMTTQYQTLGPMTMREVSWNGATVDEHVGTTQANGKTMHLVRRLIIVKDHLVTLEVLQENGTPAPDKVDKFFQSLRGP